MRKEYNKPEMEISLFEGEDIIITSYGEDVTMDDQFPENETNTGENNTMTISGSGF